LTLPLKRDALAKFQFPTNILKNQAAFAEAIAAEGGE